MEFSVFGIALIPLINALVKVTNMVGVPRNWLPIVAVVLGILAGVFYLAPGNLAQGILLGVSLGLSAIGLHSGLKNTVLTKGKRK